MDFVHLTQPCSMVLLLIVVPVIYNFMGIKNEYANQMDSGLDKYHHVDVRKATLYNFFKVTFNTAINCGDPGKLANGQRFFSGTTVGQVVTYICNNGFQLKGNPSRLCKSNGQWSGTLPSCIGK